MSGLRIHSYPDNYRVNKALIAAQYAGVTIDLPSFTFGKDNTSASFLALNPLGKVPVMETPQGPLFESNAIARYVARLRADANLLGDSFYQQGQVDQWIDFTASEIEPSRAILLLPKMGYLKFNQKADDEARKEIAKALSVLNQHLLTHTYLVGNHVTLADICAVASLVDLMKQLFDAKYMESYQNVSRWFNTCVNQPEFSKVLGTVSLAAGAAAAPAKAAAPAAAAAKPAAAEKKEDLSHLMEDDDKPKAKKQNPLDLLPASSMQLDPIKKLAFSQRPFLPDFFEQLWPQFDAAGYSFFLCTYNYNADNKVFFMTGNAVGGFIQRSDACRKYAMGVMNITGKDEDEGPYKICGAWLFRGPEVIAEMREENPDSEYYTFTKVDINDEAQKAALKAQFIGETIDGEAVLDRRYFK